MKTITSPGTVSAIKSHKHEINVIFNLKSVPQFGKVFRPENCNYFLVPTFPMKLKPDHDVDLKHIHVRIPNLDVSYEICQVCDYN